MGIWVSHVMRYQPNKNQNGVSKPSMAAIAERKVHARRKVPIATM